MFSLLSAPQMPLVAVGAPAPIYYPAVARGLGKALQLPPFAEVANAAGAVLGRVSGAPCGQPTPAPAHRQAEKRDLLATNDKKINPFAMSKSAVAAASLVSTFN